ncbi:IAA-amino acid conjugate hydrolase [Aureococcus anophagefferens]|nr:IAA-amino acid conjugate hydrolase [Aureococcus anophagefferens]
MMGSASLARSARRFASATTPPGAFSRERLAAWRHALHRQPELGFDLFKTSQFVADTLASFGGDMDITRGLGGTGVVASLRAAPGPAGEASPCARTWALPISRRACRTVEVDGVAHLCGHDGHTAMLLGAAGIWSPWRRPSTARCTSSSSPGAGGGRGQGSKG